MVQLRSTALPRHHKKGGTKRWKDEEQIRRTQTSQMKLQKLRKNATD